MKHEIRCRRYRYRKCPLVLESHSLIVIGYRVRARNRLARVVRLFSFLPRPIDLDEAVEADVIVISIHDDATSQESVVKLAGRTEFGHERRVLSPVFTLRRAL